MKYSDSHFHFEQDCALRGLTLVLSRSCVNSVLNSGKNIVFIFIFSEKLNLFWLVLSSVYILKGWTKISWSSGTILIIWSSCISFLMRWKSAMIWYRLDGNAEKMYNLIKLFSYGNEIVIQFQLIVCFYNS